MSKFVTPLFLPLFCGYDPKGTSCLSSLDPFWAVESVPFPIPLPPHPTRRRAVIVGCIEIDQNHVKAKPSAVAAATAATAALSCPAPSSFLTRHAGIAIRSGTGQV